MSEGGEEWIQADVPIITVSLERYSVYWFKPSRGETTPGFWMERRKYMWLRKANGVEEFFINVGDAAQRMHGTGETLSVNDHALADFPGG